MSYEQHSFWYDFRIIHKMLTLIYLWAYLGEWKLALKAALLCRLHYLHQTVDSPSIKGQLEVNICALRLLGNWQATMQLAQIWLIWIIPFSLFCCTELSVIILVAIAVPQLAAFMFLAQAPWPALLSWNIYMVSVLRLVVPAPNLWSIVRVARTWGYIPTEYFGVLQWLCFAF